MSNQWVDECFNYLTSNNVSIQYITYDDLEKRNMKKTLIEQAASCHFVNYGEVFDVRRITNKLHALHFFIGKHHRKIAECRYYNSICVLIHSPSRPAVLAVYSDYNKVMLRFKNNMCDAMKSSVLLKLYKFMWMMDVTLTDC